MSQIVQIVGSVLILAAFIAAQRGLLQPRSRSYLLLNVIGSAVLAIDAAVERQFGFLLLEGVWALVSVVGLATSLRRTTGGRATR